MAERLARRVARLLRALAGRDRSVPAPPADPAARPYARWWWLSGPIEPEVVESRLDWAEANGFGGVEVAWVDPLRDDTAGPRWLGPKWAELIPNHTELLG